MQVNAGRSVHRPDDPPVEAPEDRLTLWDALCLDTGIGLPSKIRWLLECFDALSEAVNRYHPAGAGDADVSMLAFMLAAEAPLWANPMVSNYPTAAAFVAGQIRHACDYLWRLLPEDTRTELALWDFDTQSPGIRDTIPPGPYTTRVEIRRFVEAEIARNEDYIPGIDRPVSPQERQQMLDGLHTASTPDAIPYPAGYDDTVEKGR